MITEPSGAFLRAWHRPSCSPPTDSSHSSRPNTSEGPSLAANSHALIAYWPRRSGVLGVRWPGPDRGSLRCCWWCLWVAGCGRARVRRCPRAGWGPVRTFEWGRACGGCLGRSGRIRKCCGELDSRGRRRFRLGQILWGIGVGIGAEIIDDAGLGIRLMIFSFPPPQQSSSTFPVPAPLKPPNPPAL